MKRSMTNCFRLNPMPVLKAICFTSLAGNTNRIKGRTIESFKKGFWIIILLISSTFCRSQTGESAWIRINRSGYLPAGMKVAVYANDTMQSATGFEKADAASLLRRMAEKEQESRKSVPGKVFTKSHGAIIRGDKKRKIIALVFTGDEFGDGGKSVANTLQQQKINASFFLTGNFYRNPAFKSFLQKLQKRGNYLGTHSDKHLLYCDWMNRDSLLVTHEQFSRDIQNAFAEMKKWNISKKQAAYFLPPYEWYNDSIASWSREAGLQLVCFTPGTRSNADYTFPEMGNKYLSTDSILQSVRTYDKKSPEGLNGFILLFHIGTDARRTDKTYSRLPALIAELKTRGYQFVKINELLQ